MEHHSNLNYLMHTKFPLPPFFQDSFFVWPPRSYSCSFCRREFRSAQALGGHMNVHRRDRARLKQSLRPEIPAAADKSSPHEIVVKGIRRSDRDEDDIVCKRYKLCSIDEIDLELRL